MESPEKPPTGGPTKDEILAVVLQKLKLQTGDIFADIGCGTGKITLTIAPLVSHVHAIDIRDEAYHWTARQVEKNTVLNVTLHHGDAASILKSFTMLDVAFLGGSKNLENIICELKRLNVRSVVIAAVMLETLNTAVKSLQQHQMFHEITHIQISKSYPIAGGIMLKPLDPVYLIHGGVL